MILFQRLTVFSLSKETILVSLVTCRYVLKTQLVFNQINLSKIQLYWVKGGRELSVLFFQLLGKSKIISKKKFLKSRKRKAKTINVSQGEKKVKIYVLKGIKIILHV